MMLHGGGYRKITQENLREEFEMTKKEAPKDSKKNDTGKKKTPIDKELSDKDLNDVAGGATISKSQLIKLQK
jgi:hypothetical protein